MSATPTRAPRTVWADNLKVVLVAGVIAAHVTMAWTGVGNWVFEEPPVREPLLTLLTLVAAVVSLFGLPLFFLLAGYFTPRSFERKGPGRFLADRALRLLVPMLAFIVLLSPWIEFVDPGNAGWTQGFWAFVPHVLWPPAPGPTWFLGVLFILSAGYAAVRSLWPRRASAPGRLRLPHLFALAALVAVASWIVRLWVPLGEERWRLALGQSPGWFAGFALGVLAAERGWLPLERDLAGRIRHVAWAGILLSVITIAVSGPLGYAMELYLGGGTWQAALLAAAEGLIIATAPLWVVDLFQRRFDRQGPLGHQLSRSAFAAFLVHQGVLVGLVLGSREVGAIPEVSYVAVVTLGLAGSFGLGWLLTKLPGVRRIV
ncbi:MAG TPA: acyltransferase [Humibacillus xanthopallidus]|nr:acyltransferase [Humibacillus xanthopallidus]